MRDRAVPVPPGLRRWVTGAEDARVRTGFLAHLPDTTAQLVFRVTPDGDRDLLVTGPRTRAAYHAGKHIPFAVRIRLRPDRAALLLGVGMHELVDRVVPVRQLPGSPAAGLAATLTGIAAEHAAVLAALDRALPADTGASTRDRQHAELVRAAIAALRAEPPVRVPAVAHRLGVSERHLRAVFGWAVGVSPKHYLRINRVRSVLRPGRTGRLAGRAADAGYYDQAHMAAEFRRTMGISPGAYLAGQRPAPEACPRG